MLPSADMAQITSEYESICQKYNAGQDLDKSTALDAAYDFMEGVMTYIDGIQVTQ